MAQGQWFEWEFASQQECICNIVPGRYDSPPATCLINELNELEKLSRLKSDPIDRDDRDRHSLKRKFRRHPSWAVVILRSSSSM